MAQVDYPAILEEAWRRHLTPRTGDAPTVISLFAGCGGSSLGYSMAGYQELLAVEWDDNAVATFKLNFLGVPVYHGDIHDLSVEQCLEMTDLQPGKLDLLDGSPPCQGFSTAGKRQMADKRNQLYMQFVHLLRGLRPKVFVMENVSGLIKGKMKLIFADIMKELKASGYRVRCKLLNAMYFNVPQSRQRLIWIGIRNDLMKSISFPEAQNKPITVKDAWIKLREEADAVTLSDTFMMYYLKSKPGGVIGNWEQTKRLTLSEVSPTLTKSEGYGGLYHPKECRPLHTNERMRLASFPDAFDFTGDWRSKMKQMGNCVPPLFMRAIARHIKDNILQIETVHLSQTGLEPRRVE